MQDMKHDVPVPFVSGPLSRRSVLQGIISAVAPLTLGVRAHAAQATAGAGGDLGPLSAAVLPAGVRSRFVDDVNGLRMHVLEAGLRNPGPAGRAAAARLSRTGLQLAQGDGPARRRRLSRLRARRARLRAHVTGCR